MLSRWHRVAAVALVLGTGSAGCGDPDADRESAVSFGEKTGEETGETVIASSTQLPFPSDSFDLVFFFAQKESARLSNLVEFLKAVRVLVGQQGLVCLAIPNRDARGIEGGGDADLPRYFDFERILFKKSTYFDGGRELR